MIITAKYLMIFYLTLFLVLFAWFLDSTWIRKRVGINTFGLIRGAIIWLAVILIVWLCILNFPVTLTALVFGCGLIALIDLLFFKRRREANNYPLPVIVENARSFFWVLLLVWVIRSFIIQPYRVPTGSLQPTVKPGDFLLVNQFAYGLNFPVGNHKLVEIGKPKRGDIVLFYAPPNPSMVYVKRLIGLPGDKIEYRNKVLWVNGQEMKQELIQKTVDDEPAVAGSNPEEHIPVDEISEDLHGVKHRIYVVNEGMQSGGDFSITVPEGQYFMMGDNRDNSDDSRMFGFVPENYLIGKAFMVWLSWDSLKNEIRWNRFGQSVK